MITITLVLATLTQTASNSFIGIVTDVQVLNATPITDVQITIRVERKTSGNYPRYPNTIRTVVLYGSRGRPLHITTTAYSQITRTQISLDRIRPRDRVRIIYGYRGYVQRIMVLGYVPDDQGMAINMEEWLVANYGYDRATQYLLPDQVKILQDLESPLHKTRTQITKTLKKDPTFQPALVWARYSRTYHTRLIVDQILKDQGIDLPADPTHRRNERWKR